LNDDSLSNVRKFKLFGPYLEREVSDADYYSLQWFLANTNRLVNPGEAAQVAIFSDFDENTLHHIKSLAPGVRMALVRNEPKVVRPQNFRNTYLKHMDLILDLGRPIDSVRLRTNWPQNWNLTRLKASVMRDHARLDRFVLMNANKLSFVSGELYSLRRKLVSRQGGLETWGPDWDASIAQKLTKAIKELVISIRHTGAFSITAAESWLNVPKVYKGVSLDKIETLSQYRYSVVIENSMEFMTEKLFDCLFSGTLPVYVGPSLESFGIPKFIAIQADPDFESVAKAMHLAKKVDLIRWREHSLEWLNSKGIEEKWSSEYVIPKIVGIIEEELDAFNTRQIKHS
jgi:hypothetical protein